MVRRIYFSLAGLTSFLLLACGSPNTSVASTLVRAHPTLPHPTAPTKGALTDTVPTFTNLEEAQAIAAATDRHILLVFSGSDWCKPCQVFKQTVLDESAFRRGGRDEYVVVYLDFPSKKRNRLPDEQRAYNDALAERYNPEGVFPRIYLLDAGGETVEEMRFAGQTAEAFVEELSAARG